MNPSHPPTHDDMPTLYTSFGSFIDSSPPPHHILLRGVNLSGSSKIPRSYPVRSPNPNSGPREEDKQAVDWKVPERYGRMQTHLKEGFWEGMELGGEKGWYVGGPMDLDGCEVHLRRLRAWGFNTIRYIVVWEALEHEGPGIYDEDFIEYTVQMIRKLKEFGFRIFIDPHQDIWSRATGGSGAPYWTLIAAGFQPRRFHSTCAAYLHSQWEEGKGSVDFPDMIWQTNSHRLAARTMFTLFFGGKTFAPKCVIDGINIQDWLQDKVLNAFGRLAEAIGNQEGLLDSCVLGWDSLNEPIEGFIGIEDLNEFPEVQSFKKGPSPTPIQCLRLGVGQSQYKVENHDFTSMGPKQRGTVDVHPENGIGCWMSRTECEAADRRWGWKRGPEWDFWDSEGTHDRKGCIWGGHDVWNPVTGELLKKDYFHRKHDGKQYDFLVEFWYPQWTAWVEKIKKVHQNAIWFCNPPVFQRPPDIAESIHNGRFCLSHHFYDGMTMLNKRRHLYNADAVSVQRGLTGMLKALKFGRDSIRDSLRSQLGELSGDANKMESAGQAGEEGNYPVLIGEIGVPFDMNKTAMFGLAKGSSGHGDYKESSKVLDSLLNACDGDNSLSWTIWNYETRNNHEYGDGWNGEDLSLWSQQNCLKFNPEADLETLVCDGARALPAFCRPFPVSIAGHLTHAAFNIKEAELKVVVKVPGLNEDHPIKQNLPAGELCTTTMYLPFLHFRKVEGTLPSTQGYPEQQHIVGQIDESLPEWNKGTGPAVLDLHVEVSEGKFVAVGQYGYWSYTGSAEHSRTLLLTIKRWGGALPKSGGAVETNGV